MRDSTTVIDRGANRQWILRNLDYSAIAEVPGSVFGLRGKMGKIECRFVLASLSDPRVYKSLTGCVYLTT
jgi:hypothetical protein